jgi:hypothetical protein
MDILTKISKRKVRRSTSVTRVRRNKSETRPMACHEQGTRRVSNLGIDFSSHELALRRVAIHSFISSYGT